MRLYGLLERLTKIVLVNGKDIEITPLSQPGSSAKVIEIPAMSDAQATQAFVLTDQSQVLKNKTIDADLNTLSNIDNGDIKAGAAIAHDKLASLTAGSILLGNASNVPTATALSGHISIDSTGFTTIQPNVIASGMIIDGTIVNSDVSSNPADRISGGKVTPNFGAQNIETSGTIVANGVTSQISVSSAILGDALYVTNSVGPAAYFSGNVTVANGDVKLNPSKGIESTTSGALNIGTGTNTTILNLGTSSGTQEVNIGTGAGTTTINIGAAGDTVNVAGTLVYVDTADLRVSDSKIILNKNGALANNTGIELEGGGSIKASILFDEKNGSSQPQNTFTLSGTGSLKIPSGTTAEQPASPVNGMIRYNTTKNEFEGYVSNNWSAIGGGGATEKVNQTGLGVLANFPIGTPLYVDASLGWQKADADTAATAEVAGLLGKRVDDDNVEIVLAGEVAAVTSAVFENPASLPAKGETVFLSPTTPGKLTITEPTVVGQISKPVGIVHNVTGGVSVDILFYNMRGVTVGGANVRTSITLTNNATTNVQNASAYEAGELTGWVFIDGTTDYRFYVQAQFARNGLGNNYNLSYQTTGDTPPAGFSMGITAAGVITATLPSVTGYATASINFALNAPAVGATLPLQISGGNVTGPVLGAGTGAAVAAGYVGQQITIADVTSAATTSTVVTNRGSQSVTPGVYALQINIGCSSSAGGLTRLEAWLGTDTSTTGRVLTKNYNYVDTAASTFLSVCVSAPFSVATTTTYYFNTYAVGSGTLSTTAFCTLVRIA